MVVGCNKSSVCNSCNGHALTRANPTVEWTTCLNLPAVTAGVETQRVWQAEFRIYVSGKYFLCMAYCTSVVVYVSLPGDSLVSAGLGLLRGDTMLQVNEAYKTPVGVGGTDLLCCYTLCCSPPNICCPTTSEYVHPNVCKCLSYLLLSLPDRYWLQG